MIKPRVALFTFLEGHQREGVYQARRPMAQRETERLVAQLGADVEIVRMPREEIRSKSDIAVNVHAAVSARVDAVLINTPIFMSPAMVAHAARQITQPIALVCNESPDTFAQLALLACAGALDQMGIRYRRIPGDLSDAENRAELIAYLRATAAATRLKGMTFGALGWRSLGISTGTADLVMWERVFGVDIEHIDQFEIIRRADKITAGQVELYVQWLTANLGALDYNNTSFTPANLDRQIRSYLATKSILRDYELDFVGIKCQSEVSNGYVLQCLNVALLNDPYDAEGMKEPMVCSCEADHDGALTMQILKLLSGGEPTNLNDITFVSENSMTLANCGAMATYFAAWSRDPAENLKRVRMVPHVFGDAGGGATQFVVPPAPLTLARLCRQGDRYWMGTARGEAEMRARDPNNRGLLPRPLIFPRLALDKRRFLRDFGSNHIHSVRGDLTRELAEFCQLTGIEYANFDVA